MGMAASQARFLGLTARQSNIEYQGQQINEQRTQLSNQSANLYNQMLTLNVPTPPSSNQFTKVSYTFTVPESGTPGTISQISKVTGTENEYTIVYTYSYSESGFPACATSKKSSVDAYNETAHTSKITTAGGLNKDLIWYDPAHPLTEHADAYSALCPTATPQDTMYYVNVGTESSPQYQYYKGSELKTANSSTTDKKCNYYFAGDSTKYATESYSPCTITRDKNNRVSSFVYENEEIAVTTNTTTDEQAYNDAFNQYTYESYLYQQEMNNINSKTSVVQAQDKNLELKLKQLDTEHQAIQTEMESVKSVIKKNSEDSFKTFA